MDALRDMEATDQAMLQVASLEVAAFRAMSATVADTLDALKWLAAIATGLLISLYQALHLPNVPRAFSPVAENIGLVAAAAALLVALAAVAGFFLFVDIAVSRRSVAAAIGEAELAIAIGEKRNATALLAGALKNKDVATATLAFGEVRTALDKVRSKNELLTPSHQPQVWLPWVAWISFAVGVTAIVGDTVAKTPWT